MDNFKKKNKISIGFFMTLLMSIQDLSKSYGSQNLFTDISFSLREGDKMGLAGPNGAGKSTLLKILFGKEGQDSGSISKKQGVRVAYAGQSPEFTSGSVEEVLFTANPQMDREDAEVKARILLDKAGFTDGNALAAMLSGGWKKRLDVLCALMQEPDIILLDEPTNHLDLEGILWLERFLQRERGAFLIVSHDRRFLENVCNKMMELNTTFPKGTFSADGGWSVFMERREAFLSGQLQQEKSLASTVRDEVEWMKRSPKARTTKSKSRMERAEGLIEDLQDLGDRNKIKKVSVHFSASERETKNLIVGKNLTKQMGDKLLFQGVDIKLSPGSRIGIVGKNGTGKTTLLKILAGEVSQDMGTVKYAQDVKVVYFDQHREKVDQGLTLREALSPAGDFIQYRGQEIHVNGWAKKFLFAKDRLNMPVHALSGGERARILIARLMLQPADVLFLDEPTNDLDIPTLEVIENSLSEFPGAVVLITHDRYLMQRICTQILSLGEGKEGRYFSDYAQWENSEKSPSIKKEKEAPLQPSQKIKKMSYKEKKELEGMEKSIEIAEVALIEAQARVEQAVGDKKVLALYEEMAAAEKEVGLLYERWQVLLDKSKECLN